MKQPRYLVAVWPHGWTLNAPPHLGAIPLAAIHEMTPLFPDGSVIDPGICHHLKESGHPETIVCVATPEGQSLWRNEIEAEMQHFEPQERWWRGVDVGASAACIFSVFCHPHLKGRADEVGKRGPTPQDADDLGRCIRLLNIFPQWREEMQKVAAAFPDGAWPALVAKWHELEAADSAAQNSLLREAHAR